MPDWPQRRPYKDAPSGWSAGMRRALLALLIMAPLAFGAVQAWAWGSLGIAVLILLAFWAIDCVRRGKAILVWSPLYVPCLALVLMALFQLFTRASLDGIGTREAILKFSIYLVFFFLTQQVFAASPPQCWHATGVVIAVYAFVIALFGIVQFFGSPSVLYGVVTPRWGGSIFGPYVNHNHFAGLMEMLIPIAVVMTLTLPERHAARPASVFAIFVCMAAVVLSGSRGGMVAIALELAVLFALFAATPVHGGARRWAPLFALTLCAAAGASFLWLAPEFIRTRWEDAASSPRLELQDRIKMTTDSLRMSRDHLAYGVGLGAFETAYPRYQTVATDLVIDYPHNDYAQFAAEAGLAGWILAPLAVALFLAAAFGHLQARAQSAAGWLQIGAAVGVCGILIHSFVDFNLHIPANAMWFAFCVAWSSLVGHQFTHGYQHSHW